VLKELIHRGASGTPLAQLVHHATRASDGEAVIEYAPLAAQQASQHGAHREAGRHYRTALLYAQLLPPADHATLLDRLSFEYYLTGRMEQAAQVRKEGLAIWRKLEQPMRIGDSLRWLSRLSWFQGNKAEADRYADEAVALLERYPPELELAMAYSNRSQLFMLAEETESAIRWGERALVLAERIDSPETSIHALTNIGSAELLRGDEAGREKIERALRLAQDLEMHDHVARCYANLSTEATRRREYRIAGPYLEEGIRYTTDRDLDSYSIYLRGWRARWHFEQGRWEEAALDAEEALRLTTGAAVMTLPALIVLGHLRARQGNPAATELLERAQMLALPTGESQRIVPMASARAEAAWWAGDAGRTITEAQVGYDLAIQAHDDWALGSLTYWIWRAGGGFSLSAAIPMAYRLMIEGNWQASAAEWERIGCPFERALMLSAGDRQARLAALAIFEQLGANPAARALREELRRQGERGIPRGPRPTTRANAQGLTAREMEVLHLLSEGLSNADIARHLSISPKTVDHHVSAILLKLDAHSRSEAVAAARNQHVLP
jgi:DNA-binding CsgD family transcriptional regulator/tetratricopeptide (TPR) repeat protein